MILISHRGNLNGPNPLWENHPDYIRDALDAGYHVEVDVRSIGHGLYLGHDEAKYPITLSSLEHNRLWCHAKDIGSLISMMRYGDIQCFFHETDKCTLTSNGYIWTYPGEELTELSIAVCPEQLESWPTKLPRDCAGICSDHVGYIKPYRE